MEQETDTRAAGRGADGVPAAVRRPLLYSAAMQSPGLELTLREVPVLGTSATTRLCSSFLSSATFIPPVRSRSLIAARRPSAIAVHARREEPMPGWA